MSIADVIAPESVTPSDGQLRDRFADLAEAPAILKAFEFARADVAGPVQPRHALVNIRRNAWCAPRRGV
ncbi:hypothetical protein [Sphingomonas sp. R86520]|uniref:hypothetical protein n=1 Tax=Sphingomonas sp. R86520 TaxID=3093859 RepID=UPI0036D42B76